jgi:hypothetical protein
MPPDPPEGARQILFRFDVLLNVWTLAWGTHAVTTDPSRFFDSNALYPTQRALSYSDHQLGVLPWFAPVYLLTGNPILAYQAALFLSAISCGWLFALLVTRWTGRVGAGTAAGVVAIAAPFHLYYLRVLIHFTIQYLPLALLCVDVLVAGRRRWLAAAGLVLAVTLQALCSVYMVYTTALLVGLYGVAVLIAERRAAGGGLAGRLLRPRRHPDLRGLWALPRALAARVAAEPAGLVQPVAQPMVGRSGRDGDRSHAHGRRRRPAARARGARLPRVAEPTPVGGGDGRDRGTRPRASARRFAWAH